MPGSNTPRSPPFPADQLVEDWLLPYFTVLSIACQAIWVQWHTRQLHGDPMVKCQSPASMRLWASSRPTGSPAILLATRVCWTEAGSAGSVSIRLCHLQNIIGFSSKLP